jgi:hypothetical protein
VTRQRSLAVVAVAGVAIFALSLVNAWIVHDREVRGEGFRFVQTIASAWRGPGLPVLTIGVVAALTTGIGALLAWTGRVRVPGWALFLGAALALGLIGSAAWPVSQDGHASSVDLSPGLLLPVGLVLALAMVGGTFVVARPPTRVLGAAALIAVVAFGGGAAGRWFALQQVEGTGRHWSEGSYTRTATGGEPTETLTISGDRVEIGDRWAGSWEWSGWTVVIDNDPACPDSRGTYHAHGVGEEDLRFVMVVDTCQDGARAADLQTGIWERDS